VSTDSSQHSPNELKKDENLVKLKDFKAILYLLRFTSKDRGLFIFALAQLTVSSIVGVASARALGLLAEEGLSKGSLETSIRMGTIIIVCEIAAIAFTYFGRRTLSEASLRSVLRIRSALFTHLNQLPMRFFDTQPQGRIVTRITHDVETMESFFSQTLARLLNAIISLTVVLTAMIILNWQLGLMIAACMLPAMLVTFLVRNSVRKWNREFAIRNSAINAQLSEYLNGVPVIRSFGIEAWTQNEFDQTVSKHLEAAIHINRLNAWSRPLIMFLSSLPIALLIGFGGIRVLEGGLALGMFISFVRLVERFLQPMNVISQEIHVVQTALTNTERVASFLQHATEEKVFGIEDTIEPLHFHGDIVFDDVVMGYDPEVPVLKGVSFHIRAGEKIGLAGRTGSGKTSTLALLSRLYEFQKGDILVDGQSIRNIRRSTLREAIGVVNQDAIVFKAKLRENLQAGLSVSDEDLIQACHTTGFDRVMKKNGMNLDTEIYDQGANLSAGERQLLSLTRILIKNPKILVLDEATANIDPIYEELVHQAVEKVMTSRTCFIIAHRIDTLKNCDRILVFKEGRLQEEGSLDDLLSRTDSYYKKLYDTSHIKSDTHGTQLSDS